MRCEICGGTFAPKVTFASFFRTPRFCPGCRRRYAPGAHFECVPIDGGKLLYAYVYDEENADNHLATLLFDRLGPLFLEAAAWNRDGAVVILLELAETAALPDWFLSVAAFRDVRCFSLFRADLERFSGVIANVPGNP